jgi:plasmid stabilization system protein ParE
MFKVRWERRAVDELANIWTSANSDLRQAVTRAADAVDQRLSGTPRMEGESRSGDLRITFVPPLAIDFRVEPDSKTVSVLHVRLSRRRGS